MPGLVRLGFHSPPGRPKTLCFTGSIARSATRRYLSYSDADFEVFTPQGRRVAQMGVKFGFEERTFGPLLYAKFHPHRCNGKGIGPPKLNFY